MWWQRTAKIWLGEKTIHILKVQRDLLGRIRSCQGDTYPVPQKKEYWLGQPQSVYTVLADFFACYGLAGWQVFLLLSGRDCIWKQVVLGSKEKEEALSLIAEEELLGEETAQLIFDAAGPKSNDSGLYTWGVGAYHKEGIHALCQAGQEEKVCLNRIDLWPALISRLQKWPDGTAYFPESERGPIHVCKLSENKVINYQILPNWPQTISQPEQALWRSSAGEIQELKFPRSVTRYQETHALHWTAALLDSL